MSLQERSIRAELEDKEGTSQLPGLPQPWAQEWVA